MLLYLSYNRGSKSGGFTFSTGTPYGGTEVAFLNGIPFDPETLNAYEIGVKSNLAGSTTTLNVSAFYYDYRTTRPSRRSARCRPSSTRTRRAKGLEIELNARPPTV